LNLNKRISAGLLVSVETKTHALELLSNKYGKDSASSQYHPSRLLIQTQYDWFEFSWAKIQPKIR
jgi:hypothetical protein